MLWCQGAQNIALSNPNLNLRQTAPCDHNARPFKTDRQTDDHHNNSATIRSNERIASRAKNVDHKNNKSVQSNLGRGPRRGAVAHVHRKVPIGYNGAPQIHPQKYPFQWTDPQPHYLPHPWTRPTYDAKRHPGPIRRFSTMHWTDRPTHRQIVHDEV